MTALQRLKLVSTGIYWVFALLFAFMIGRITVDFDWASFQSVLVISGTVYGVSAALWWALAQF